ncbi:MAG: hypothetical protein ACREYF_15780 [Gammaproteobacteria bacterium]
MKTNDLLVTCGLAVSLSLSAAPSFSASCTYDPGDMVASGDVHYVNLWGCERAFRDFFWDAYDFDKGDWDEGFGYDDSCNIEQPLARTFNALYALHYSHADPALSKGDREGPILRWGGSYAWSHIDELDARCGDGTSYAYTRWGPIIDNYTNLYLPFFYELSVPERAGTILHEARHADGKGHDAGSNCPRGVSCDSSWDYNGANRWQVTWLWWYRAAGVNTTEALQIRARDRGNAILRGGFKTDPGFVIS